MALCTVSRIHWHTTLWRVHCNIFKDKYRRQSRTSGQAASVLPLLPNCGSSQINELWLVYICTQVFSLERLLFFTLAFHFLAVTVAVTFFFFSSTLAFLSAAFSSFFLISSSLCSFLTVFFFLYRDEVIISYETVCLHFVITLDCLGCTWMDCGVTILWLPAELENGVKEACGACLEIRWVRFSSVITILFVFWFILEVHSYYKVGELFMRALRGHEYNYFFSFCTLNTYKRRCCRYFLIGIPHCWKLFCFFFPINFVSSKAYTPVANNYKKIMKFTLTLPICGECCCLL